MTDSAFEPYLSETQNLECDHWSELHQSRRRAWQVAGAASSLNMLALLALLMLLPLKQITPVVLRVDNATGHVEMITTVRQIEHSYGEVVDSYFINQYVLNRETYEYATLATLYDTTALLSSTEVQEQYYNLFSGANARHQQWGANVKVLTQIQSIIPDTKARTAVVRFTTQAQHQQHGYEAKQHWTVSLSYRYVEALMGVAERRHNPLGFQITSYRRDPETVSP